VVAVSLAINFFIQQVKYTSWIKVQKGKLNDRILTTKEVTNKPNLNKLLWSNLGYCDVTHLKTSPIIWKNFEKMHLP
jgi:hypothetical protein